MQTNETVLLTLEDLHVGQIFKSGEYKIDAEQIKTFAQQFDPQPFHTDEVAAKDTFFEGLAASGWHTAAITMRLLVASIPIKGGLVGGSGDITWPLPTRPGDSLHVECEIINIRKSASRPDRGVVRFRSITYNQNKQPVQKLVSSIVVVSLIDDVKP